jgi:hypothetical protein
MEVLRDAEWFRVNRDLPAEGVNLEKDVKDTDVSLSEVCCYFGPKSSKSGWKYLEHSTPAEAASILALYCKVYGTTDIPNKELTLQFARGLFSSPKT